MSQKANESIEFANNYCDFSDPNHIWLMKGISRSKDNPKEYHKFFRRMTLSCIEDIQESYDEIKQLGNQLGTTYRIYLSLNSRDVVKANFNFAKRLMDIAAGVQQGLPDMLLKSKKLGSEWKTELEQRRNRGTKRILIDVDDPSIQSDVSIFIKNLVETGATTFWAKRKTPNGYAFSIEACDTRGLLKKFNNKKVDMHRDSMLFLEQYEGQVG
jgi:hypothetical protein